MINFEKYFSETVQAADDAKNGKNQMIHDRKVDCRSAKAKGTRDADKRGIFYVANLEKSLILFYVFNVLSRSIR